MTIYSVDTDLGKVPVESKDSDGSVYSKDASRFVPSVEIPIPVNTETKERTFTITVLVSNYGFIGSSMMKVLSE